MGLFLAFFGAGVLWIYGGYAAFIAFFSRRFPEREYAPCEPGVSVIVPAYNEGTVIEGRLRNLLAQAYPAEKLQIIVVDSGSTDSTREKVSAFAPRVELVTQGERLGKGAALAFALRYCRHGLVIVTDANSYFEPDTVARLVRPFSDPKVGGVTGSFSVKDTSGRPAAAGTALFRDYENGLRPGEDRIDSCVSLFGEIFACRAELLTVDEANMTEDFESSVAIRRRGYRLAYAAQARVYEIAPSTDSDIFIQRKRVLTGTLQTLAKHRGVLFNPGYGFYGMLILPGHKLFPVLSPFFLAGFIAVLAFLYPFFFLLGAGVFVSCMLVQRELFKLARYAFLVNAACLAAWKDFLEGNFSVKWKKMESTRI